MATVFMKWLETKPEAYARGIQLLTLGRLKYLHKSFIQHSVQPGLKILEIGCGTGTLTKMMADAGAKVSAIDVSPEMVKTAQSTLKPYIQEQKIAFQVMDASSISRHFQEESFDLIVGSLVFSEFTPEEQDFLLTSCKGLLAKDGKLVIIDEIFPSRTRDQILFSLIRTPLALVTWFLTRTTTRVHKDLSLVLDLAGYNSQEIHSALFGSLIYIESTPAEKTITESVQPAGFCGTLKHRPSIRNLLFDIWSLFFRIIPPYPKVKTGLYALGKPDSSSPVLVTGNYDLTVRRMVKAIDGKLHAWILVADSSGINVWCGAGGGYFTADKIISALHTSHVADIVHHKTLILPQLCANGVDGGRIRSETGWKVLWGPVKATDIPEFIRTQFIKTDRMRLVKFPLIDRLEMVTVTLGFYGVLLLIPVFFFWRTMFFPITASLCGLSYFYAVTLPWLPGKDGLAKGIPLTLIAWAGLLVFHIWVRPLSIQNLFNALLGLTGLSIFTAAEMQGMSPLMRGEQANWGWESVIGASLGLIYWIFPNLMGWR